MLKIRRSEDRGHFDHGWLDTRHTFSFSDYHDERFMGYRSLRVINEDRVVPGAGFGTHGHRDMEIISYVLEGQLAHKDSLGNGSVIVPGDVQYMSAGTGVRHSEFNASRSDPLHFVQIWILPNASGLSPRYDQRRFDDVAKRGRLRLVASGTGDDGSITIRQDVGVYASILDAGGSVVRPLPSGRAFWVQVLRGAVDADGARLSAGDGLAASDVSELRLSGAAPSSELLLFDLG